MFLGIRKVNYEASSTQIQLLKLFSLRFPFRRWTQTRSIQFRTNIYKMQRLSVAYPSSTTTSNLKSKRGWYWRSAYHNKCVGLSFLNLQARLALSHAQASQFKL